MYGFAHHFVDVLKNKKEGWFVQNVSKSQRAACGVDRPGNLVKSEFSGNLEKCNVALGVPESRGHCLPTRGGGCHVSLSLDGEGQLSRWYRIMHRALHGPKEAVTARATFLKTSERTSFSKWETGMLIQV